MELWNWPEQRNVPLQCPIRKGTKTELITLASKEPNYPYERDGNPKHLPNRLGHIFLQNVNSSLANLRNNVGFMRYLGIVVSCKSSLLWILQIQQPPPRIGYFHTSMEFDGFVGRSKCALKDLGKHKGSHIFSKKNFQTVEVKSQWTNKWLINKYQKLCLTDAPPSPLISTVEILLATANHQNALTVGGSKPNQIEEHVGWAFF